MKNYYILFMVIAVLSCSKEAFLEKKPDDSLVIPLTLADYQAILDNDMVMNGKGSTGSGAVPIIGEMGADNYFVRDVDFPNFPQQQQNVYIWNKQVYDGSQLLDWDYPYRIVFYSNIVLEGLGQLQINTVDQSAYNLAYGSAHFFRAHSFYHLAQVFAPHYDAQQAEALTGIPIRLGTSFDEKIERTSLAQTYQQIISDLETSVLYLPDASGRIKTRPSKQAAYGLLSRVYLTMGAYPQAKLYADSCLALSSELLDYGGLNAVLRTPFPEPEDNPEVLFSCKMTDMVSGPLWPTRERTDSSLYASYESNDLRKTVFFRVVTGGMSFKGSYENNSFLFAGIATDEILLNRAECLARMGMVEQALADLHYLLEHRYQSGSLDVERFSGTLPQAEALEIILIERRKELLHRGLRWTDLRRLNAEGAAITLRRQIGSQTYTLAPGDPRWVWPIPDYVLSFNPDMKQNDR